MPERRIDLNCDLGEDPAAADRDDELAACVTSLNIACGGHAGDERTMRRLVHAAVRLGRAVGAHPGYPDRANFGRVELAMTPDEVAASISSQLHALAHIATPLGTTIAHLKPHGALYHAAMTGEAIAVAIARAAKPFAPILLVGLAGAPALAWWKDLGFPVLAEAFADRRYRPDGSLVPRSALGSLIGSAADAAAQALRIALGEGVIADNNSLVPIAAGTICIHSDTPGALAAARAVNGALKGAGIERRPPDRASR